MSLIKDELIKSLEANYIETIRNGFYEGTAVRALIPPLHENETKKVREARNTIPKILDSYLNQRNFNGRTGLRLTPFMVTDTLLIETDDSAKGTLYSEANNNGNVTEVFSTQDSVDASQTDSEGQQTQAQINSQFSQEQVAAMAKEPGMDRHRIGPIPLGPVLTYTQPPLGQQMVEPPSNKANLDPTNQN